MHCRRISGAIKVFKKGWYKVLAWLSASFFFFMLAALVVSMFGNNPSEAEIMRWMTGMMDAMHSSIMAWTNETHGIPEQLLQITGQLAWPAILAGGVAGVVLRVKGAES